MKFISGRLWHWGYIPDFLDEADPRPAAEQINEHYVSGWQHFAGFKLNEKNLILTYGVASDDPYDPPDPPMSPLSVMSFRKETLAIYESAWVLIMQEDKTWEVARLD